MSEDSSKQLPERIIDQIHVPDDAGEYRQELESILRKIPDGWGRWISCDRGWYPIIVEVDRQLEELIPGYQVNQIKEKFGTLSYYFDIAQETDPYTLQHPAPHVDADKESWNKWSAGWESWAESEEGKAYFAKQEETLAKANQIVQEAARLSATTCELCGKLGENKNRGGWLKTTCAECEEQD